MTDYIDTREDGWRRVDPEMIPSDSDHMTARIGGMTTYWVREDTVPPLPTEPGYYIDAEGSAWRLGDDGEWDDTFGNPLDLAAGGQPEPPLVRYEPRAVTAKAVLDRIDVLDPVGRGLSDAIRTQILREFEAAD